ncbi:unnamed protein product [Lepidochelys kempii]
MAEQRCNTEEFQKAGQLVLRCKPPLKIGAQEAAIRYIEGQVLSREHLVDPPSSEEVWCAITQTKNYKAPGPDGIQAEVFKAGGTMIQHKLCQLRDKIWTCEEIPPAFKHANIVTIFKKWEKSLCGNYKVIALLCITGKILARILLNRLLPLAEELFPKSQCGFRPSGGTTDMIFVAQQIQEKCREQHQELFIAFIKAFDSISCDTLWKVPCRFRCRQKVISIIRLLRGGMTTTILCNSSEILIHDHLPHGIGIEYRMDGQLLNLRRLQTKSKIMRIGITDLQYADDCHLCIHRGQPAKHPKSFCRCLSQPGSLSTSGKPRYSPSPHLHKLLFVLHKSPCHKYKGKGKPL